MVLLIVNYYRLRNPVFFKKPGFWDNKKPGFWDNKKPGFWDNKKLSFDANYLTGFLGISD
jgi:hypothetical protein